MHTSNQEDRRGHFVVDPSLPRQALAIAGFHLTAVAICIGVPFLALTRAMNVVLADQSPDTAALFDRWPLYLTVAFGVYVLVATTGWLLASLRKTHRTAGPIVRLTRFVHELAAGNFSSRLHLRERDELAALADGLNTLAEDLESRDRALLLEITERVENIGRSAEEPYNHDGAMPSDAPDDIVALVDTAFETAVPGPQGPAFPHPN